MQHEDASKLDAAEAAMRAKRWELAGPLWEKLVDQAHEAAPPKHYLRWAQALRRAGDLPRAREALDRGIVHHPGSERLRREAGIVAALDGDWNEATDHYERCLTTTSSHEVATAASAGLITALGELERFDNAASRRRVAIERGVSPGDLPTVLSCRRFRRAFATRLGLDADLLEGAPFDQHRTDAYRIAVGIDHLNGQPGPAVPPATVSAVEVSTEGGWGNRVLQLATAVQAAEALAAERVHVGASWFLRSDGEVRVGDLDLVHGRPVDPDEAGVLSGRFLYRATLGALLEARGSPYDAVRRLRSAVDLHYGPPLDDDALVIHLRAGDVFRPQAPNRRYGQPPLSYYLWVLEHHPWRSVHLVFEDLANPVIAPLIAAVRERDLALEVVQTDLRTSLELLLRARTLVASRGTLVPAVVGLSPQVRRIYTFEGAVIPGFSAWEQMPGVTELQIVDERAEYRERILSDNWENTPDQRDLMVSYPGTGFRPVTVGP